MGFVEDCVGPDRIVRLDKSYNSRLVFGLAASSRLERAATYDYEKWLRYQRTQAAKMGMRMEVLRLKGVKR